jgi:acetyl-CoA carboxylase carboxyltransferase component
MQAPLRLKLVCIGGKAAKLDPEEQARVEEAQRAGPYQMATGLGVDDVIDPRKLRNRLLEALRLQRSP